MKREDIIYLTLLLVCIPFGHVVKSVNSPHVKQFLTLAVGLIVALSTAGFEGIWHSALTILGNFILVKLVGLQYVLFLVYSLFLLLQTLAPAVDKANLLIRHKVQATLRTSVWFSHWICIVNSSQISSIVHSYLKDGLARALSTLLFQYSKQSYLDSLRK